MDQQDYKGVKGMNIFNMGIGKIVETVGNIADDLFTSDEERLKLELEDKKIDAGLVKGQLEVNKAEALHKSIFVAGWRPFIGWVGGFSLAYAGLIYPLLCWFLTLCQGFGWIPGTVKPPPMIESGILGGIVTGMLGIGTMRSFDKKQGTNK